VAGGVALVVGLVALAGCGPSEAPAPPETVRSKPTLIQAELATARVVSVPIQVEVTGQVAAVTQATLSSKVQGTVHAVRVREGSTVSRGQTLVVLDNRDLKAELARADAEVENARLHWQRMEQLFASEAVSRQELENATRAYKVAEAARQGVLARLSYTEIKAPFAGVVTQKHVEAGELASPGQPLLTIEDPTRLRLEATVAEGDVQAVSRGARVPVVVDALDGGRHLTGTVAQVLPSGDPATHTFLVKVDLPPTPGLKTGMFGRMLLERGARETIVVPRSAVVERGHLTGVFTIGPDMIAHLRWVTVGRAVGEDLEVLSGLAAGERVLADGTKGAEGVQVQALGSPQP
jgi:RND family efflux transporter MFP subunit